MYFQGYDDRKKYYRCKVCSCYYRRERHIERHARKRHNVSVLSSVSKKVFSGQCKFCGCTLDKYTYNNHVKTFHADIFFSADRRGAEMCKRKHKITTDRYDVASSGSNMYYFYQETNISPFGYQQRHVALMSTPSPGQGSSGRERGCITYDQERHQKRSKHVIKGREEKRESSSRRGDSRAKRRDSEDQQRERYPKSSSRASKGREERREGSSRRGDSRSTRRDSEDEQSSYCGSQLAPASRADSRSSWRQDLSSCSSSSVSSVGSVSSLSSLSSLSSD